MEYNGTVYRPPVEWDTFLLPVTEGCTHNSCRFCSMYKDVPFRPCDAGEVEAYMRESATMSHRAGRRVGRVYLVGADPFALSAQRLEGLAGLIRRYAPECETITMYARVTNIMRKSDEGLARLRDAGIDDLYVGVETGLSDVLENLNKGNTADECEEQLMRLNAAGIRHRDMLMLGAAGRGRALESAKASAGIENRTKPAMILVNSMSLFPETALYEDARSGKFETAGEKEMLMEERAFIDALELPDTWFWAMHPLDAVRFEGRLGTDRGRMRATLDGAIEAMDEGRFSQVFQREKMSI